MFKINDNYLKLPGSYLFSTIGKKVAAYQQANPDKEIIRLGIGDVTQPLAPAVIDALHKSVDEMGHAETFHGYAPDLGYEFLRSAIADHDYKNQQHCGECRADYRHGVPEVPECAALLFLSGGLPYRLLLDPDVFDFLLVHTLFTCVPPFRGMGCLVTEFHMPICMFFFIISHFTANVKPFFEIFTFLSESFLLF